MWSDIPGWFSSEIEYRSAVALAPTSRPSVFVEIGVALGRSVAFLAEEVRKSGKPIRIIAIDPFYEIMGQEQPDKQWIGKEYKTARDAFEGLISKHAPEARKLIDVKQGLSWDIAPTLPDQLDFVFIDGCHEHEAVKRDIATFLPKMRAGGVIAGDDFSNNLFPGVIRAVQEAFFTQRYSVRGVTWWVDLPMGARETYPREAEGWRGDPIT